MYHQSLPFVASTMGNNLPTAILPGISETLMLLHCVKVIHSSPIGVDPFIHMLSLVKLIGVKKKRGLYESHPKK